MRTFLTLLLLFLTGTMLAGETTEMADALRQDGKFWVVVVCLLVILLGLLTWVFLLDKKLSKLEKELPKK